MIELAASSSVLDTPVGKRSSRSSRKPLKANDDEDASGQDIDADETMLDNGDEEEDTRSIASTSTFTGEQFVSDYISPTKQFVLATGKPVRSSYTRSSKAKANLKIASQLMHSKEDDENIEPNLIVR